ncbi:unnamed protein product [Albugo candida]|uniref:Endoribonuclease L-PSP/chorismate mutase-like domain-containing protein n=1 Tax=Albugo candida TaxID=65357 RepID=A0A024GIN6_9STRA|nr:unnamed protein product [Albugo candida]|eukprot:CCI46204.1 unnamed protein product [Albugo candida]
MLKAFSNRLLQTTTKPGVRFVHIEKRLKELGYTLPPAPQPKGNYRTCLRTGNTLYIAGHLPFPPNGGELICGKVGKEISPEQGYKAAQYVALNLIATIKEQVGDLDKVKQVIRLGGFVNCVDGYTALPGIINGASDLFCEVFGDKGLHARLAVGNNALPFNIPVEIEAIVEVE